MWPDSRDVILAAYMHIHFDLVGGISGDMFIGAMLDCFPGLGDDLQAQISLAGFDALVTLVYEPFNDGILSGTRFSVTAAADAQGHQHRHYSEIRAILENSNLDDSTRQTALDIFHILAIAEAKVHAKPVDTVAFHEVGAWDSIADVVCASYLINAARISSCSISALPLGGGQVKTSHGMLPIPTPATALILEDFDFVDDGISGERITPTGAAILKFLAPGTPARGKLLKQGFGFGRKKFPGISNVLRILQFEQITAEQIWQTETITQMAFELDDQTAEEIATALDNLRQLPGIIDVVQYAVTGKKNRLSTSIRVLCENGDNDRVLDACFRLTTTLGIRQQEIKRSLLKRTERTIDYNDQPYRIKIAERPGGATVKGEMADLAAAENVLEQRKIRRFVETPLPDEKL